jgi:hypothetical protein
MLRRRRPLVTPAKANVQGSLGSGFRRNDQIVCYAEDFIGFATGSQASKELPLPGEADCRLDRSSL